MKIMWNSESTKYLELYWENNLCCSDIEKYSEEYDALYCWYPVTRDSQIFNNYGDLLVYIEQDGNWDSNSYSYQINLSNSMEKIWNGFDKTYKYEIRRNIERDDVSWKVEEKASQTRINEYLSFYNSFVRKKEGMSVSHNGIKESTLSRDNRFYIFTIKDNLGNILSEQTYFADEPHKKVILNTSASIRLDEEDKDRLNLIARSNKRLHYESIAYFKKQGFEIYDFSGAYFGDNNEGFRNITIFKERFGGTLRTFCSGFVLDLESIRIIRNKLEYVDLKKKLIIWGWGKYGKWINKVVEEELNADVILRIDSNTNLQGVDKPAVLEKMDNKDNCLVLIATPPESKESIEKYLDSISIEYVFLRSMKG